HSNIKANTGQQSASGGDEKKIGDANETVLSLATTPDARIIFAGSHDGVVHVWNSERKLLAKLLPANNEAPLIATTPITVRRGDRRKEALISLRKELLT